jgi:hypothetical protein
MPAAQSSPALFSPGKTAKRSTSLLYVSLCIMAHSWTRFKARRGSWPSITSKRADVNRGFELTIPSVKVRRRVIIEEHPNQDAIERTDRRHSPRRFYHSST